MNFILTGLQGNSKVVVFTEDYLGLDGRVLDWVQCVEILWWHFRQSVFASGRTNCRA